MNREPSVSDDSGKDDTSPAGTLDTGDSPWIDSASVEGVPEDVTRDVSVSPSEDNRSVSLPDDERSGGESNLNHLILSPGSFVKSDVFTICETGQLNTFRQGDTERIRTMLEAHGTSSSQTSNMPSDDENFNQNQNNRFEVVPWDLKAGLAAESTGSVDEEEMHGVDLCGDSKTSALVEVAIDVVSAGATCDDPAACGLKALADSQPSEPLLSDVQTDDTQSSQEKDEVLHGENKLTGDALDKGEGHGLRKRRGIKVTPVDLSVSADSGAEKMPEDGKGGAPTVIARSASIENGQESKTKPTEKKPGKQGKSAGKTSTVRRFGDIQCVEDRAKDESDTNRKLPEPLDNFFFRQTIRCEPFTSRPADKPLLQRLRPDGSENHVTMKYAKSIKADMDPRYDGTDDTTVLDSHGAEVDVAKEANSSFVKGMGGLGRGLQHSRPAGMVTFAPAAGRGTDLQGWLSASKVALAKCDKCAREFCSSLNHRRHVRVHRRSLNPEKEDLSKERSKVAAFWDKLTPAEASSIVHYENMEIEDLSGQRTVDKLSRLFQQPGSPLLPQGILKAGELLLDIVQSKPFVFTLSSEGLFSILDDATERTFLYGGTSVPVQRFVFNNDAKNVGLEERNLIASLGFHIELKLVKAWMADKEAEALRCQQALFNEEEAAEKKRAKLLEKKRMKKKREKKRKGVASQSTLQDLENESIDDEGNIQGIGEEDESPIATGSSSSSVVSGQDFGHADYVELDMTDKSAHVETSGEFLDLGVEPVVEVGTSSDDVLLHVQDELEVGAASLEASEFVYRNEIQSSKDSNLENKGPCAPLRATEKSAQDDVDSRQAHSSHVKSGRPDVQSGAYFRKVEQERGSADPKRREFDRSLGERKSLRTARERARDELVDSIQRSGRGFEMRYGDGSQTSVKPLRKGGSFQGKNDTGDTDLSRVQQYRCKPSGLNRGSAVAAARQGIWTRKVPQVAAIETSKDEKEGMTQDDVVSCSVADIASCEGGDTGPEVESNERSHHLSRVVPDVGASSDPDVVLASNVMLNDAPTKTDEKFEDSRRANSPDLPNNARLATGGEPDSCIGAASGALLVGSLSVPLGRFAVMGASHSRSGPADNSSHRPDVTDVMSTYAAESSPYRGRSEPSWSSKETSSALDSYFELDVERADPAQQHGIVPVKAFESSSQSIATQTPKLKPTCPPSSPEKGDSSRYNPAVVGPHERQTLKQGSWQSTVGRPAASKVWRPIGTVMDRHDLPAGLRGSRVDSGVMSRDTMTVEDVDTFGAVDREQEIPGKEDLRSRCSHDDDEELKHVSESLDRGHDGAVAKNDNIDEITAKPSQHSVLQFSARVERGEDFAGESVESSHAPLSKEELSDKTLASDFSRRSATAEDLGVFLKERWNAALKRAYSGEILDLKLEDSAAGEDEGTNFLDSMSQHIYTESPGAGRMSPSSAPVVSGSIGRPRNDGDFPLDK